MPDAQRLLYEAKRARAVHTRCQHVAGIIQQEASSIAGSCNLTPLEHHAVRDVRRNCVIHYHGPDGEPTCVREDSWDDFVQKWPRWRVVQLPSSAAHAEQVLVRAYDKEGEAEYNLLTNNCEHFATYCFSGDAVSLQALAAAGGAGVGAVGGAGAGIGTGIMLAHIMTEQAVTTSVPYYWLGIIPAGTTTQTTIATVRAFSMPASVAGGVGAGVAVATAACLGTYGVAKWVDSGKIKASRRLPIAVVNNSNREISVTLKNKDASFAALKLAAIDDIVHDMRAWFGIGVRSATLGSGIDCELNPPAEEDIFHRFQLHVFWADETDAETKQEATMIVQRGDVIVFRNDRLCEVNVLSSEGDDALDSR